MMTENLQPINYFLDVESGFLHLNQLLGKTIRVEHSGSQCLNCGLSKPIFRQGHCQSCFFDSPATGDWIMRPELSKAHLGQEDRDLEYESKMQLQPHTVYLALSSHLKVGVTRKSQLPTRWIDQGAHQATIILEVPNRYLAGVGEVALKNFFSDKTNWRKMLKGEVEPISLVERRDEILAHAKPQLDELKKRFGLHAIQEIEDVEDYEFEFPVLEFPTKVTTHNFDKNPTVEGTLKGIKGQYLILDTGVINIRKFTAYHIEFYA